MAQESRQIGRQSDDDPGRRARADDLLGLERATLRATLDHVDVGLAVATPAGEIVSMNAEARRIHGFGSERDVLARWAEYPAVFELHTLDGRTLSAGEWPQARAAREDSVSAVNLLLVHRTTGDRKIVRYSVVAVRDACGQAALHVVQMRDRTEAEYSAHAQRLIESRYLNERRRADEASRRREDGLRQLVEYAPVAIAMLDTNMRYVAASGRWRSDFRVSGELAGRSHYDVFPEMPAHWKAVHRRCLAGAVERSDEEIFVRADGSRQWLRWEVLPWRTAAGHVGGIIIFTEDITTRREAEQRLRDSEQRLRLALDAAGADTWTLDLSTNLMLADDRIAERLGMTPGAPIPFDRTMTAVHPDDIARVAATIDAVRRDHGPDEWDIEYRRVLPDGRVVWRQSVSRAERDGSGRALRVSGISLDITARKASEAEIARSHLALQEHASELELRTAQLSRLASDLTLAEQRAREQLARTLHDHLQQLLFSAKLKLDRLSTGVSGARRAELVVRARGDLDEAIAAARSLSVELFPPVLHEGGLPAALAWLAGWMEQKYGLHIDLTADGAANPDRKDIRTLVFESVRELLFNVVKHATVDRAAVDLTLTPDDDVRIAVADKGAGFDAGEMFDHGPTRQGGFGLFSIRERLALLGGQLAATSRPGQGAEFVLTVPRRSGEGREDAAAPEGRDASAAPARAARPPLRIVIADDHARLRTELRDLLDEVAQFQVVGEAANGREALALARVSRPDVILMDVSMPEMDGIEATRQIRAELPSIQVVGLSTQERAAAPHAIEEAGARGYFSKSGDTRRLIEHLLALHAAY